MKNFKTKSIASNGTYTIVNVVDDNNTIYFTAYVKHGCENEAKALATALNNKDVFMVKVHIKNQKDMVSIWQDDIAEKKYYDCNYENPELEADIDKELSRIALLETWVEAQKAQ